MKLRNKKTGEIDDFIFEVITDRIDLYRRVGDSDTKNIWHYNSLAELNEEWEDVAEEPKEYWTIDEHGKVHEIFVHSKFIDDEKEIGNYFETKEEAEKAVEKLKAVKRLKDKGLEITDWLVTDDYEFRLFGRYSRSEIKDELDLLFGGEE